MSKKQAQDVFLGITLALVVVAGAIAALRWLG